MSFLNPIRGQYKRLTALMDGLPCADLHSAAETMRVSEDKVSSSLAAMVKKGLFGEDRPYVDRDLSAVVLDRRYAAFTALYSGTARLKWNVSKARNVCIFTPQERSQIRSRTAGSFIRDLVDGAVSGDAADVIRTRGGAFLRNMISPETSMPDSNALTTFTLLETDCDRLLSHLGGMQRSAPDPEVTRFVETLDRQVLSYLSCYPANALPTPVQQQTADGILARIRSDYVPRFSALLDRVLYSPEPKEAPPKTPISELKEQSRQLMALSGQLQAGTMRTAVSKVAGILNEISDQLEASPAKASYACIRSLRSVYLPMMQELLMKYIRYERILDPGPETVQSMRSTEAMFEKDLPKALRRLLRDLRSDSAIDMESQAEALRQKMQLDGLLDIDGK